MSETITATGLVATEPRHITTSEGLEIASFRLASNQRRYNKKSGAWEDADTNWFTVTAFRRLAANAALSLRKGDRVVVTGRLRLNQWTKDDRSGTTVEIDAEAIGHDLCFGSSSYVRTSLQQQNTGESAANEGAANEAEAVPTPF